MRHAVWVVGATFLLGALHVEDAVSQPPTSALAVEIAKQRQETVRSVAIEFRVNEDVAEGAYSSSRSPSEQSSQGLKVPAKTTKLESTNRLVISGNKTRYECNHPAWNVDTGRLHSGGFINTMDGEYDKLYFPVGLQRPEQPEGFIGRTARSNDIKSYLLTPLTLWYRGFEPSITPQVLTNYHPSGSVVSIRGRACQEYSPTGNRADATLVWFDQTSGSSPRRIRVDKQGKPRQQFDIDYQLDASGVWVPVSWVRNEYAPDGRVLITTKVDVVSTRLNEKHPDTTFDIRFPVGTRLYNARERKDYIVQNDETLREFDLATGEILSDTAYQPGTSWIVRNQWWLVACVCVLLVVFGLVWTMWGRRKRK